MKNANKVKKILEENISGIVLSAFKSVRKKYREDSEMPKGFLKDFIFKKQIENIKDLIKKQNIKGDNIYFNLSLAGYGKTTEIVRKFELGQDSIVVSFLNTTIDRVIEKLKEEKKDLYEILKGEQKFLTKERTPAKTIHSVAYRVLRENEIINPTSNVLDFEKALDKKMKVLIDLGKLNNEEIKLFRLFKHYSTKYNYSSDSWLDLPLLTLTFDYYLLFAVSEFLDAFINAVVRISLDNENLLEDILSEEFLILSHYIKKFFKMYYEVIEPLYFDSGDFLNFTSLLGLSYKLDLKLFNKENLKNAFILANYDKVNIIVDEAQDLNPLMVYLIFNSYNENYNYYFYGDPLQAISSFQGSSINFFLTLPDLVKTKNYFFSNRTYRLNEFLTYLINKKVLPYVKKHLANQKLESKLPFNKIESLNKLDKKKREELKKLIKEIQSSQTKFFSGHHKIVKVSYFSLNELFQIIGKERKVAILLRTNNQVLSFLRDSFNLGFILNTTQRDVLDAKIKLRELRRQILSNEKLTAYDKEQRIKHLYRIFSILLKYPFLIEEAKGVAEIDLILEDFKDYLKVYENVFVSTIHSFKGKEADLVFLSDNEISMNLDVSLENALLYYTSVTRAKDLFFNLGIDTSVNVLNEAEIETNEKIIDLIKIIEDEYFKLKDKVSKKKRKKSKDIPLIFENDSLI